MGVCVVCDLLCCCVCVCVWLCMFVCFLYVFMCLWFIVMLGGVFVFGVRCVRAFVCFEYVCVSCL